MLVRQVANDWNYATRSQQLWRAGNDHIKRVLDISLALPLLVFFAPVMLVIAVVVRLDGGPALFFHERVGRKGRLFRCIKFRSMAVDADQLLTKLLSADSAARAEWERDQKLACDPRVTAVGRILRKSSLDELPQLLNVLKGEMSLVGPRPIVPRETVRYGRFVRYYYQCRPGITGLWQVSGRNDVSYRRRVALDCMYARQRGLRLDLIILVKTAWVVLIAKGAS